MKTVYLIANGYVPKSENRKRKKAQVEMAQQMVAALKNEGCSLQRTHGPDRSAVRFGLLAREGAVCEMGMEAGICGGLQ